MTVQLKVFRRDGVQLICIIVSIVSPSTPLGTKSSVAGKKTHSRAQCSHLKLVIAMSSTMWWSQNSGEVVVECGREFDLMLGATGAMGADRSWLYMVLEAPGLSLR